MFSMYCMNRTADVTIETADANIVCSKFQKLKFSYWTVYGK